MYNLWISVRGRGWQRSIATTILCCSHATTPSAARSPPQSGCPRCEPLPHLPARTPHQPLWIMAMGSLCLADHLGGGVGWATHTLPPIPPPQWTTQRYYWYLFGCLEAGLVEGCGSTSVPGGGGQKCVGLRGRRTEHRADAWPRRWAPDRAAASAPGILRLP